MASPTNEAPSAHAKGKQSEHLFFQELNSSSEESTIIFLHGGGTSHLEWSHVVSAPHLTSHHILIPDLPCHSRSRHIRPMTLKNCANKVAELIREKARGGKAHLVGLSFGGFVAQTIVLEHAEVCLSCFATGSSPWKGMYKFFGERPRVAWYLGKLQLIPGLRKMIEEKMGLKITEEMRQDWKGNDTLEGLREMMGTIAKEFGWDEVRKVAKSQVRVLSVSGAKGDQIESAREVGRILKEEGEKIGVSSRAVVIKQAVHPWDLQLPDLFARGVKAWVEEVDLPMEFEPL